MFVSLLTDYSLCALKVVRLGAFLNTFILWQWSVCLTWKQRGVVFQRLLPLLNYQEHTNKKKIIQSPDTELHASEFTTHSLDDIHSILWLSSSQCFMWCLIDVPLTSLAKKCTPTYAFLSSDATRSTRVPGTKLICCRPCVIKIAEGVSLAEHFTIEMHR